MHIVDVQITLTGTPIVLSAQFTSLPYLARVSKLRFTPDDANSHVVTITGPNGVNIKRLAPPSSSTAIEDELDLDAKEGRNLYELAKISVNGTSGEKVNVAAFIG